ncbi:hypothetical protein CspHIS471_0610240 [Cutaneotrichosporon sp. HIS471]|nr:hypothetical protein CspHIS471_0610240 [Cutaneotrichosporon sp. HIS471]
MSTTSHLGGGGGVPPVPAPPRPSRDMRGPPPTHTPTLAEIQAIQQANPYDDVDHATPSYPSQRPQLVNGPESPYAPSPYGGPQQRTPPSSQQHLYNLPLPPGARPPSPNAYGASTPPSRLNHMSQNSLHNVPTVPQPPPGTAHVTELDQYAASRSRGYSSASQSGRGSDHEGGGGVLGIASGPGHLGGMLNKPRDAMQPSPLAQSYMSDVARSYLSGLGKPQPALPEPPKPKKEKQRFWKLVGDRKSKDAKEAKNKDVNVHVLERVPSPLMAPQPPPHAPMDNVHRPSAEDFNDGSIRSLPLQSIHGNSNPQPISSAPRAHSGHGHSSSIGHGFEDHHLRGHGININLRMKHDADHDGDDVGAQIRKLCGSRGTTFQDVLDLCDKVNGSEHSQVIGREATRCIYKVFKVGNDRERRMAARVWLITMNNIVTTDFHRQATNRKLLGSIERILKRNTVPQPSSATYKRVMEIVSGVTYDYHANSSCENLLDLWNNVKRPEDPEFGTKLPNDYLRLAPDPLSARNERTEIPNPVITSIGPGQRSPLPSPAPSLVSRPPSEPLSRGMPPQLGVPYSALPDHDVDMRRLIDECNSALATATKLHAACVFTRPDQFDTNSALRDLHRKAVRKFDSLNSQMAWAESQAEKSRRTANSVPRSEQGTLATPEESAMEVLLNAHGQLANSLTEYGDLENRSIEELEVRLVQERSKTDTRRDYTQQRDMLMAPNEGMATSSRSQSPSHATKPQPETGRSPRTTDSGHGHSSHGSHVVNLTAPVVSHSLEPTRSRSPSPGHGLPLPPKIDNGQSPPRSGSPQGRVARVPGPRPQPTSGTQQFRSVNSNPNLVSSGIETHGTRSLPGRGDSGSSGDDPIINSNDEFVPRPSRKALGKRRAVADKDSDFDPNDLFMEPKQTMDATTDDTVTKPEVKYVYDAWEEANREKKKMAEEAAAAASAAKNLPPTPTMHSPAAPTVSAPIVSAR